MCLFIYFTREVKKIMHHQNLQLGNLGREGVRILKIGAHVVHKKIFGNFLGLIYIVNSEIFRPPRHPVRPI